MAFNINSVSEFDLFQFSSVFDRLSCRGDKRNDSPDIPFKSFLQQTIACGSGTGRDAHSLMLSIQHFLCWPRRSPPSKMPWRKVLERLSWRVTCPDLASFPLSTVARGGYCRPTRKLILLLTQPFNLLLDGFWFTLIWPSRLIRH